MAWRTTDDPRTEFATLRFTEGEMADVDAHASTGGMTRSGFLRDCVRRVIAAEQRKAARLKGQEV